MSVLKKLILSVILVSFAVVLPALAAEATDVTDQCAFKVDGGKSDVLTDGDVMTAWEPGNKKAELKIKLPEGGAGYICIDWLEEPSDFEVLQYNLELDQITVTRADDTFSGLRHVFPIDEKACYLALRLNDRGQKVSSVSVWSAGELPRSVQNWYPPLKRADILVIAARPGDEFGCFGGVIPYNAMVENRRIQVVYMTGTDRAVQYKSLAALWDAGIIDYPDFIGLDASESDSVKKAVSAWGGKEKLVTAMVALIRLYQPEVVVTHAKDGENNDVLRAATAQAVQMAVEASWDEQQYAKSAEKYGAWQVKKLYTHLGSEDIITLDWNQPSERLDGATPLDAARKAYDIYDMSIEKPFQGEDSTFCLAYTHVGKDMTHDSMFENVLVQTKSTKAPELPAFSVSEEPEATPAIAFSPEPTIEPTPEPSSAAGFSLATRKTVLLVCAGIGVMLVVSGVQVLMYILRRRRRRWYDR